MTLLQKIGFGLLFGAIAMFIAGWQEVYRKEAGLIQIPVTEHRSSHSEEGKFTYINSACADQYQYVPLSAMSVWWQAIPYVIVGLSEIFACSTGMEFFYSQAPVGAFIHHQALARCCFVSPGGFLENCDFRPFLLY